MIHGASFAQRKHGVLGGPWMSLCASSRLTKLAPFARRFFRDPQSSSRWCATVNSGGGRVAASLALSSTLQNDEKKIRGITRLLENLPMRLLHASAGRIQRSITTKTEVTTSSASTASRLSNTTPCFSLRVACARFAKRLALTKNECMLTTITKLDKFAGCFAPLAIPLCTNWSDMRSGPMQLRNI